MVKYVSGCSSWTRCPCQRTINYTTALHHAARVQI